MLNFLKNFFLNLKQKQDQDILAFPSDNLPPLLVTRLKVLAILESILDQRKRSNMN